MEGEGCVREIGHAGCEMQIRGLAHLNAGARDVNSEYSEA
jgi:hypothetical protein